ncbi:MAG: hypothetical protein N2234_03875 [Planctomycetota bacterium]|nr:hypothetical protein [Planctomycetota bacterium]
MSKVLLVVGLCLFLLFVFADDEETPRKPARQEKSEWMRLEDAMKKNEKSEKPFIVVVMPKEDEFLKKIEEFLNDKDLKASSSHFLKVLIESSEENEALKKVELSKNDKYLLLCDFQLVKRKSYESMPEDKKEFLELLKKIKKENEAKQKVMDKVRDMFKAAERFFNAKDYPRCIPTIASIMKTKETYDTQHESDNDYLKDSLFDKSKEMLDSIKSEFANTMAEAEKARRAQEFDKAMSLVAKARAQFSLLEGAEEQIKRLEEQIQQDVERYRKK